MAKKIKFDPELVKAAQLPDADGRDVAAEQATKATELEILSADEQAELAKDRKEREEQRLADIEADTRKREQRDRDTNALLNKPLTATERVRLEQLEKVARGDYPPKQPHPPLGKVPPQMMKELAVLRRRAQVTANTNG
jgi:hypothetical protein